MRVQQLALQGWSSGEIPGRCSRMSAGGDGVVGVTLGQISAELAIRRKPLWCPELLRAGPDVIGSGKQF